MPRPLHCGLLLLGLLASAAPSARAEQLRSDDLGPPGAFALRWGDGRCWEETPEALPSIRCVTDGRGQPVFVATSTPYAPPVDLRGDFLEAWLRVDDLRQLGALELRLSSDNFESNYFAFEVPLYGDLEFNYLQDARWARYTFSFSSARLEGTPDRARINAAGWLVKDQGRGGVDAAWSGLASVPALSRAAVSLTFDDGSASQLEAARAMARHDFAGTAYIIPDLVGVAGFMTLEQLRELHGQRWEIAGHHGIPLTQMRADRLDRALLGVQRFLRQHGFGDGAAHFAYPLGKIDTEPVLGMARKYFETARIAGSGPETLPPADPHRLRVRNVLNTTPPEEIARAARDARANGDWLILMFHHVRAPATTALEYDPQQFERMIELLHDEGIEPETVGSVWRRARR